MGAIFGGGPCAPQACKHLVRKLGTPLTVANGVTLSGRDPDLVPGGAIGGTITGVVPAGSSSFQVRVVSSEGLDVLSASANLSGAYVTPAQLPSGTYYAYASSPVNAPRQLYSGLPCGNLCNALTIPGVGTPITVAAPAVTSGIDFSFAPVGRISGRVTNAATGNPVASLSVGARSDLGVSPSSVNTAADGTYSLPVPPGTYRVYTTTNNYRNEVFDDRPCGLRCSDAQIDAGSPLTVAAGGEATGVDFALLAGGVISGTVTSAATGQPLQGVSLRQVERTAGTIPSPGGSTDASGAYSIGGLPDGTYHLYTINFKGYVDELLGDVPCQGFCDPNLAPLYPGITIAGGATVTGVNFALDSAGSVSGTVIDAATNLGINNARVYVLDASGNTVASGTAAADGVFTARPVRAGTYFLLAEATGYGLEFWDNVPCPGACPTLLAPQLGAPVTLTAGQIVTGRNFTLERVTSGISGTVTHGGSGHPVVGANVRVFDAAGRHVNTGGVLDSGRYTVPVPPGTYYLSSQAFQTFADEAFDNIPCREDCTPANTNAAPIVVTAGAIAAGKNFALDLRAGRPGRPRFLAATNAPGGVLIRWSAPNTGGDPDSYVLEAGLTAGSTIVSFPVTGFTYVAAGVPPGRYYLRVRGINAAGSGPPSPDLEMIVGPGGVVAPRAPTNLAASLDGRILTLSWTAPDAFSSEAPADYVVEAGTGSGLTDIGMLPGADGTRAFRYDPVPDGFYFLRVRARNAGGLSRPSNEVMVVVGSVPAPPPAPIALAGVVTGSTVTLNWFAPSGTVSGYIVEAGIRGRSVRSRRGDRWSRSDGQLHQCAARYLLRADAGGERRRTKRGIGGNRSRRRVKPVRGARCAVRVRGAGARCKVRGARRECAEAHGHQVRVEC